MNDPKILSKTKSITALELYKIQVQNIYDGLRAENEGKLHIPAHMGGVGGQRELLSEKNVLDVTEVIG